MARFRYTEEDMENALRAIDTGCSVLKAAKTFNVPRTTLSDKIKGKSPLARKMGPESILSKEEEVLLVKWMFHIADHGFPITKVQLLDSVQILIKNLKKPNPFTKGRPGRHWYEAFMKRHPQVSERTAQNLTSSRVQKYRSSLRAPQKNMCRKLQLIYFFKTTLITTMCRQQPN